MIIHNYFLPLHKISKESSTFMKELELKYGCNPNQKPSRIFMTEGELPLEVLNGRPGYKIGRAHV